MTGRISKSAFKNFMEGLSYLKQCILQDILIFYSCVRLGSIQA